MFDFAVRLFCTADCHRRVIFARKAFNQSAMLRARLDALEATGLQARPGPPPLTPREQTWQLHRQVLRPNNRQPLPMRGRPRLSQKTKRRAYRHRRQRDGDAPAAPQPGPGFEERIGTRWVVWVGGLTLALGGFSWSLFD